MAASINTLADIICNAFNKDYTTEQAVEDLVELMNQATMMELRHGSDSPQHTALKELISIQERLVKTKQNGHPALDQLGSIKITPP